MIAQNINRRKLVDNEVVTKLMVIAFFLFFFWSGLRGSKAYSLWGGVIPSPSIGYDYL